MSHDRPAARPTVVFVGDEPPDDDRLLIRRHDGLDGADLADADCVVVRSDADLGALEAVDVPSVVYDPAGDPAVAARASRYDVSEYVPGCALEGESLADRILENVEVTDRTGTDHADERTRFRQLFEQLPDAVVDTEFVDGEPIVRGVNPSFEETFGYDESELVGRSVNDVLVPSEYREEAKRVDRTAIREGDEIAEVERETAAGRRTFLFRGFHYPSRGDATLGFGIYTDVTERLEQERRLHVLHRVLRHNLRNEMTALIGYADLLAERTVGVDREYAECVRNRAKEVASLGDQVQRIEQALDDERRRRAPVDPVAIAERVAGRYREEDEAATIRVTADDPGPAIADELLELAVENLVENAVEHAGPSPSVEISVGPDDARPDRWLEVTVRDDGPGLPERERAVVGGEQTITQLNHSKGLGLWITRWIAEGVGGQLAFEDRDGGAGVTVRLQRLTEDPSE